MGYILFTNHLKTFDKIILKKENQKISALLKLLKNKKADKWKDIKIQSPKGEKKISESSNIVELNSELQFQFGIS